MEQVAEGVAEEEAAGIIAVAEAAANKGDAEKLLGGPKLEFPEISVPDFLFQCVLGLV